MGWAWPSAIRPGEIGRPRTRPRRAPSAKADVDPDALVKLAPKIARSPNQGDPADATDECVATGARCPPIHGWSSAALPVAARAAARDRRAPGTGLGRRDRPRPPWPPWPGCSRSRTNGCMSGSSPTRRPRAGPSRMARKKDPAANQNAQSIVIHSLHRPGAPGIDPPATRTGSSRPAATPTTGAVSRPHRPPEHRRMNANRTLVAAHATWSWRSG